MPKTLKTLKKMVIDEQQVNSPIYASPITTTTLVSQITSLIALSHTIRLFPIKWHLIRSHLLHLLSTLSSTATTTVTTTLPTTLSTAQSLATHCLSPSFTGKLLMQSNLDVLITQLHHHSTSLSTALTTPTTTTVAAALIVSKPSHPSSIHDMRFFIKDLFTRLKIGDSQMKLLALVSLNDALTSDVRYSRIILETEGFILSLVVLLEWSDERIHEETLTILAALSVFESDRGVLIASGVIPHLIRVVEVGRFKPKAKAIQCLECFTHGGDNAWALSAHGGVTALLEIIKTDDKNMVELSGLACCVLKNVAVVEEIKRFMIEEGVVSSLIRLIKGKDNELGLIRGVEFIQALAFGDDSVRQLVVNDGGARALVRVLDPKLCVSFKSREIALRGIENLCYLSLDHVNLIIRYGFIDNLLFFLRKGDASMQELAFKSATRLCGTNEEARRVMGDAGFMAEFVKFLEVKSYEIREMAAEALSRMVTVPKNRKKFAQQDCNIVLVLQLLDPKEGCSGNVKFLLSILMSISSCNNARRKINHSGYVKNIEKLADSGVSDAKKIVRKLSTNRFKSLLNGIWHSG